MRSPSFSTTSDRSGLVATIGVNGDVDMDTCDRLWTAIEQAFGNGAANVVLDLTGTTFMDSSGLGVIVRAGSRYGTDAITIRHPSRQIEKVFEMFDYLDPATFDYNSVTQNPTFGEGVSGAVSGPLQVKDGDVLQWECHIVNDSNIPLTYSNSVKEGEMCNVFGMSLGPTINCLVL